MDDRYPISEDKTIDITTPCLLAGSGMAGEYSRGRDMAGCLRIHLYIATPTKRANLKPRIN